MCQILLLKSVDLSLKDGNGLLAKQVTNNTQIVNLIEKYEDEIKINTQEVTYFEEIKEEEDELEYEDRDTGMNSQRFERRALTNLKDASPTEGSILESSFRNSPTQINLQTSVDLGRNNSRGRDRPQSKIAKFIGNYRGSPKNSMDFGRPISPQYKAENILNKDDASISDLSVVIKLPKLKEILRLDMKKLKIVNSLVS